MIDYTHHVIVGSEIPYDVVSQIYDLEDTADIDNFLNPDEDGCYVISASDGEMNYVGIDVMPPGSKWHTDEHVKSIDEINLHNLASKVVRYADKRLGLVVEPQVISFVDVS